MREKNTRSKTDIDWVNRKLCRDESCIGVIGPDGRCKECGMPFSPQEKENTTLNPMDAEQNFPDTLSETTIDMTENTESEIDTSDETDNGSDWGNRILCVDESCIGVVGPDGKCKECGKPYRET